MKIIQLEYFCAVCRYRSITQAAQKLFVTQPAISNAIRELEKEFSVSLFMRSKNQLILTMEGEIFYKKASGLLNYIHQTTSELLDLGKQVSPLRIGIPPLLSTVFFPDLLTEFQKHYPDILVELFEYGSMRASSLVADEALDIALVNMSFSEISKHHVHEILSDRIVFCISPNHALSDRKSVTVEDLKDYPLILYNTDSVLNATLHSRFDLLNIKPHIIMHASQLHTIRRFVERDLGGAFLYSSLMKNLPNLVAVPIVPVITQEIGLVWKKGKYVNESLDKFIWFAKKYPLVL